MARSYADGGDSKQALTIALVMFVLVSIFLGGMAYFGYAEQASLVAERDKFKTDAKSNKERLDKADLQRAMYSIAGGIGSPKDERDDLLAIQGLKKASKELSETYVAEVKKLNAKGIPWDDVSDKPDKNFAGQLAQLKNNLTNEEKLAKDKGEAFTKATTDYQRELANMREAKTKAEEAMAGTKDDVNKRIKGIDDNYNKVVKEFQDNIIAAEKFAAELAKLQKEKQDVEAKLQAALKDAEEKVKNLELKVPQIDLLAYDKPKGKITRIDAKGQTAFINLGSADLARPGLTFSIFPVGGYKPNAERRGSLELINVIGEHQSMARITDVKDAVRDPIVNGDELFNPSWSPGLRVHVAVSAPIDMTGDGRDGTVDFVRNLERQGVAVDAYLDTNDMSVKGKGVQYSTNFLIRGENLTFDQVEVKRELTDRQTRKLGIKNAADKMFEEAVRKGVTVVPARTFMAMMGFKISRRPASSDDWNTNLMRRPGLGGGMDAGKGEAMPGKGEAMPGKGEAMPGKGAAMPGKAPDKDKEKDK